ncbi:hypothetical protein GC176_26225 [bacterium]|nr:hypothetical protein [bacterium]
MWSLKLKIGAETMNRQCLLRLALAVCLVINVAGCGGGRPSAKSISVDGTLTIDGKPFGPAAITFKKISDEKAVGLEAEADAQGKFNALFFSAAGEAPEGLYQVAVTSDPANMDLLEVPKLKSFEVDIASSGGSPLKLDLTMLSDGSGKTSAGPDPNAAAGADAGMAPASADPAL